VTQLFLFSCWLFWMDGSLIFLCGCVVHMPLVGWKRFPKCAATNFLARETVILAVVAVLWSWDLETTTATATPPHILSHTHCNDSNTPTGGKLWQALPCSTDTPHITACKIMVSTSVCEQGRTRLHHWGRWQNTQTWGVHRPTESDLSCHETEKYT
jgi:hypothetical protein